MPKLFKYALIVMVLTVAAISFIMICHSLEVAKIVLVKGSPKIMKVNTDKWIVCDVGGIVDNGDRIKTLKDEVVEVAFTKKGPNIVRIEQNADVFLKKNEAPYSLELLNGAVMASIKNLPRQSTFEIRTPAGLSGARGTAWRSDTDGKRVTFDSYEKHIYVRGIDKKGKAMPGELIVEKGFRAKLERFERPERVERLSERQMKRWNRWQGDLRSRRSEIARVTSSPASGRPAAPAKISTFDKSKLDKIGRTETRSMDRLEAQKSAVIEMEDLKRIEQRLEPKTISTGTCSD